MGEASRREDALRDFVAAAGRRMGRPNEEVQPYVKILLDNWYDSPASIMDTKPEELAAQGIPLRFAKELVSSAGWAADSGRSRGGKGKGKGESRDRESNKRWRDDHHSNSKKDSGDLKQRLDLWDYDPAFNLKGAVLGEKGRNVRHIQDQTSSRVWLNGEQGEAMSMEVSARNQADLSKAVRLTKDLLGAVRSEYELWTQQRHGGGDKGGDKGRGKGKSKGSKGGGGGGGSLKEVLELFEADDGFSLRQKLIGDHGRNVHHIQDQTGARLWFNGNPLQLEISAESDDALHGAVNMAQDLITAVYDDYMKWAESRGIEVSGRRGKGKGKDRGKDRGGKDRGKDHGKGSGKGGKGGDFSKVIKMRDTDPGFKIKGGILGEGGRNIHHIQDQSSSKLWLSGDSSSGMKLEIRAQSQEDLDQAEHLCRDLIKSVYQSYDEWIANGSHRDEVPGPKRHRSS